MTSDITPSTFDSQLDDIILDLVHTGSMLPAGKTINAGMFPEQKQAIKELVASQIAQLQTYKLFLHGDKMVEIPDLLAALGIETNSSLEHEGIEEKR